MSAAVAMDIQTTLNHLDKGRSNSPAFIQDEDCDVAKIVSVCSLNTESSVKDDTVSNSLQPTDKSNGESKIIYISNDDKAKLMSERLVPKYKPNEETCKKFGKLFICMACGDQFCFESSLDTHKARLSMNIQYDCVKCKKTFLFHNKCTLLLHVKTHQTSHNAKQIPINVKSMKVYALSDEQMSQIPNIMVKPRDEQQQQPSMIESAPVVVNDENTKESKISCCGCGQFFVSYAHLAVHLGKNDLICSFAYKCKTCSLYLPRNCALIMHTLLHSNDTENTPLLCPECGRSFTNVVTRDYHIKFGCLHYSRIPTFKCPCCKSAVFEKDHFLLMHIVTTHMDTYKKCHSCPLAFKTHEAYNVHAKNEHAPAKPSEIYRCPLCETVFTNPSLIRDHVSTHVENIKKNAHFAFKCIICSKFSDNRISLQNHMYRIHSIQTQTYYCDDCGVGCTTLHDLKRHVCSKNPLNKPVSSARGLIKLPNSQLSTTTSNISSKPITTMPLINTNSTFFVVSSSTTSTSSTTFANMTLGNKKSSLINLIPLAQIRPPIISMKTAPRLASQLAPVLASPTSVASATPKCLPIAPKPSLQDAAKPSLQDSPKPVLQENPTEVINIDILAQLSEADKLKKKKKKKKKKIKRFQSKKCVVCKSEFSNIEDLCKHLEEHQESGLYTCTKCLDKTFSCVQDVKEHEAECERYKPGSSKQTQFKCSDCSFECSHVEDLEEHKKLKHGIIQQYPCLLCGFTYDQEMKLQEHFRVNHDGKIVPYTCEICKGKNKPRTFNLKLMLHRHLISKHRMGPAQLEAYYSENSCKETTNGITDDTPVTTPTKRSAEDDGTDKSSPIKRLKVAGDVTFVCAKCAFSTDNREEFRSHIADHKATNSVQCLECGLCFAVFPSLEKHLIIVHKSTDLSDYNPPIDAMSDDDFDAGLIRPLSTYNLSPKKRRTSPSVDDDDDDDDDDDESSPKTVTNILECTVCYRVLEDEPSLRKHMRNHGMAFIRSKRMTKTVAEVADESTNSGAD